jgi:GH25 family lysozyme M1 (1,4-beta-N-acetylmuramidase)
MAWKHKLSADRRLDRVEADQAAQCRMRHLWRDTDETSEQVRAKMRAMIANGEANPGDKFVVYSWKSSADGTRN